MGRGGHLLQGGWIDSRERVFSWEALSLDEKTAKGNLDTNKLHRMHYAPCLLLIVLSARVWGVALTST